MKTALVCGAGGFIGSHLVKKLKKEGFWVRGVDLKYPEFSTTAADDFVIGDLRDPQVCNGITDQPFDELVRIRHESSLLIIFWYFSGSETSRRWASSTRWRVRPWATSTPSWLVAR